jgi:hypothetical protein
MSERYTCYDGYVEQNLSKFQSTQAKLKTDIEETQRLLYKLMVAPAKVKLSP